MELVTAKNVPVLNPAFDLVPHELVSAIITEYKVHYPPYNFGNLKHLVPKLCSDNLSEMKVRNNRDIMALIKTDAVILKSIITGIKVRLLLCIQNLHGKLRALPRG